MKHSAVSVVYSPDFAEKLLSILGLILRVTHLEKEPYNGADLNRDVRTVKNVAINQADFEIPERTPPSYCKTISSLKGFVYSKFFFFFGKRRQDKIF